SAAEHGDVARSLIFAAESMLSTTRGKDSPLNESFAALRTACGLSGGFRWTNPASGKYAISPVTNTVLASPDGKYFLTSGLDGKVIRWDIPAGTSTFKGTTVVEFENVAAALTAKPVSFNESASRTGRSVHLLAANVEWLLVENDRCIFALRYTADSAVPV